MNKKVFIRSFGCQMNERDSEEVLGILYAQGYGSAENPEGADVVLLNTCSVREHAEERAFGKMAELSSLKKQKPDIVLGIIGCMAKLHKEAIFDRLPQIDLIAGPAELYDLPYLLAKIQEKRQGREKAFANAPTVHSPQSTVVRRRWTDDAKISAVSREFRPLDARPQGDYRRPGVSAFVSIVEGCDKHCSYCIVPFTRGREISRPASDIIGEIGKLVDAGYKEVTLLGQNVNSYGKTFPDGSGYRGPLGRLQILEDDPESLLDFSSLLRRISAQTRIRRLRFTTSHPFDADGRLFLAMRDCPCICEWLHLPVQSGSSRILRAMRRGYSREIYLKKIESLRRLIPDISISTDIIVGFPTETEEDFEQTKSLINEVGFDSAYIFKYSPRPGTSAASVADDVPQEVKEERNQELLALADEISVKKNRRLEGKVVDVLIEGKGRKENQLFGRTRGNHGVIIDGPESIISKTVAVKIGKAQSHTLFGRLESLSNIA
jgi:tRNA-2-methylthio-N6-dimethylallyladenosine synthase